MSRNKREIQDFEEAAPARRSNLVSELWGFLKHNKKWWLAPIIVVILLVTLVIVLSGTTAAPFIYTVF